MIRDLGWKLLSILTATILLMTLLAVVAAGPIVLFAFAICAVLWGIVTILPEICRYIWKVIIKGDF